MEKDKQEYVVGFLFSPSYSHVALIEKKRPTWQQGYLNGIGGHVEDGEEPLAAMIREFREEAGLSIVDWQNLITVVNEDWIVHFFQTTSPAVYQVTSMTDEEVQIIGTNKIHIANVIPNLRWMIPLCRDPYHVDGVVKSKAP